MHVSVDILEVFYLGAVLHASGIRTQEVGLPNPLIQKLEQYVRLSSDDRGALASLVQTVRTLRARQDVIREGEKPEVVNLILEGWACRYKLLEDGRRQNISIFLPGDLCDLHVFILRQMDHSIGTLTPVRFAQIRREEFEELTANRPRVTQALWWDTLVTAAVQREWTVNLGQRDALERIAHLVCELHLRLRAVGLTDDGSFDMPLTQIDLAEATGMASVHVNRTIQELRARGLLNWKGRRVHVPNLEALRDAASFNPNYLHLGREGQHLDANFDEGGV